MKRKYKFKVGDRVRVISTKVDFVFARVTTQKFSFTEGQKITILKQEFVSSLPELWYTTDLGIGGLWENELEPYFNGLQLAIIKAKA